MAIVGFILAGIVFGRLLPVFDPQSTADLDWFQSLSWWTAAFVVVLTWLGTWRVEARSGSDDTPEPSQSTLSIRESIRTVFQSPGARTIFLFLFLADFSFFVQEFVLEAFGGEVFELPVGVTTSFNVTFGIGMVVSMLAAGSLGPVLAVFPVRRVLAGSCLLGACSFAGLAFAAIADAATALHTSVFILGVAKGLYNVGLAHLFTRLAHSRTAGVLMGAWGAFGGFAVALGALSGGILQGWAEHFVDDLSMSYGLVFGVEVLGLLAAMLLILRVHTLRLEK
jgi:BCD family chlorophyll transporter-like MFS transporter